MIDQIIAYLTFAVLRAIHAFFNVEPKIGVENASNLSPETPGVSLEADIDEDHVLEEKLATLLNLKSAEQSRYLTPFDQQLTRYFKDLNELTRSEIVESFLLALGDTADEISSFVDSDITCSVEQEYSKSYFIMHGHLKWDVDNLSPRVYAIAMELLKDGFTFMADSKTFVITSRVKK